MFDSYEQRRRDRRFRAWFWRSYLFTILGMLSILLYALVR